jgi:S-adenosylmethionine:tRNA ribosyltransferase-isomerase
VLEKRVSVKGAELVLQAERLSTTGNTSQVCFTWDRADCTFADVLDAFGELPIPPYLNRQTEESDKTTYQTVYSKTKGSVAAPTAGLHFTKELIKEIQDMGVEILEVTLDVGLGTFRPCKEEDITKHDMHTEHYRLSKEVAEKINTVGEAIECIKAAKA